MPPRDASEAPKMRVVIAPASSSSAASSFSAHAFSLPHPRTGKDVQFLLHRSRREGGDETVSLLEASRFAPSHGSWFYGAAGDGGGDGDGTGGESSAAGVCSDPGVLLLTEVDPLLVALPALDSARALKSEQRRKNDEEGEGSAAKNNDGGGRFVDAEAAVCGGERGEDCGKRAAAALALLVALAGGGRGNAEEEEEEERRDAEMAPAPPPPPSSSPAPLDCSPPLSPPSPRSRARSDLLRAAGRALSSVCEVKSVGGDSYFRLCERRTEAWLRLKAGAAAAALKRTGGPAFAGLEGEALEAAGGALVAEWLPREWSERMGWPSPGSSHSSSSSSSRPASAPTERAPAAAAAPSWAPAATTTTASGPFTRDPNLPSETETFAQREERYQQAGDFAKKVKMDAAAAAREKARAARQDAKALAAKKEASTMKSLAGFFVVKKK